MRVFMYWNLHRKVWSIKALEGANRGRVIAHCSDVRLEDCEFRVSEAGRQRVIREQRKNVHAGIVGRLMQARGTLTGGLGTIEDAPGWFLSVIGDEPVTYNPYRGPSFMVSRGGGLRVLVPVSKATEIRANGRSVVAFNAA